MKVLQVIGSFGNGGAEKFIVELSNELSKANEVVLVSIKEIQPWMFAAKRINSFVQLYSLNKKKGLDTGVFFKLYKILRKEKPDIVHIHLSLALNHILFLIPFFKQIKFVFTIHSDFQPHEKKFSKYRLFPFFSKITFICLSDSIRKKFNERFPRLVFKTIQNGISDITTTDKYLTIRDDVNKLRVNKETKIFLYIGNLGFYKNIPLLLDVFDSIKDYNIKLIIIGKGDSKIEALLREENNKINANRTFLGAVENVGDYLYSSDALILTSRVEGLPIVVLEALSVGLPVIATPVGSLNSIVNDGINGFLSKTHSKKDVIRVIDSFLRLNADERKQISFNNNRLFSEKFSIKKCSENHILTYSELMKS